MTSGRIRVARRSRYTPIDRETLNDARLSFRARGVLGWLLDKPDDWTTSAERVSAAGTEGRDAIRTALTELEVLGYLRRSKWRDATTGKWCADWAIFERPDSTEPAPGTSAGNPTWDQGGLPAPDNQQRLTSAGQPAPVFQASLVETEIETEIEPLLSPPTQPHIVDTNGEGERTASLLNALTTGIGRRPATKSERRAWRSAAVELVDASASPADVVTRCELYRNRWPDVALTPAALVRHWSSLVGDVVELQPTPTLRAVDGCARCDGTGWLISSAGSGNPSKRCVCNPPKEATS